MRVYSEDFNHIAETQERVEKITAKGLGNVADEVKDIVDSLKEMVIIQAQRAGELSIENDTSHPIFIST